MTTPDDPDLTAAELALGVLEGDERAIAVRRVLADPAFAREVEDWRGHLAALHAEWPTVDAGPAAERRAMAIPDGGATTGRRRLGLVAVLSGVAAAALLAIVLVRPGPAPVAPPVIVTPAPLAPTLAAVLKPKGGEPFTALFYAAAREMRLGGGVAVPRGHDAELWVIGADGVPHAAGIVTNPASRRLHLEPRLAIVAGATLAISVEPAGGSPKAVPTGPVVATGELAAI